MKEREQELIQKALDCHSLDILDLGIDVNKGETIKQDVLIDEEFFANSTITIWQTKGVSCPETKKYFRFQNVIIEFQISFACFTNPHVDLYLYCFKRCV